MDLESKLNELVREYKTISDRFETHSDHPRAIFHDREVNYDKRIGERDLLAHAHSLSLGGLEIEEDRQYPRISLKVGNYHLVMYFHTYGLTGKYAYEYHIRVFDLGTVSTSHHGQGYGNSGFSMSRADTIVDETITEQDPYLIQYVLPKFIKEFTEYATI